MTDRKVKRLGLIHTVHPCLIFKSTLIKHDYLNLHRDINLSHGEQMVMLHYTCNETMFFFWRGGVFRSILVLHVCLNFLLYIYMYNVHFLPQDTHVRICLDHVV